MMEASPIQLTLGTIGLALVALIFIYIAARLGGAGVARSWWEYWDKHNKGGKRD